jgi:hypothetical protein
VPGDATESSDYATYKASIKDYRFTDHVQHNVIAMTAGVQINYSTTHQLLGSLSSWLLAASTLALCIAPAKNTQSASNWVG